MKLLHDMKLKRMFVRKTIAKKKKSFEVQKTLQYAVI